MAKEESFTLRNIDSGEVDQSRELFMRSDWKSQRMIDWKGPDEIGCFQIRGVQFDQNNDSRDATGRIRLGKNVSNKMKQIHKWLAFNIPFWIRQDTTIKTIIYFIYEMVCRSSVYCGKCALEK